MNLKWLAIAMMFFAALAATAQDQTLTPLAVQDQTATTPAEPEQPSMTPQEKLSYGIGAVVGKNYLLYKKDLDLDLDIDMFVKGIKDAYMEEKLLVSDEDLNDSLKTFQEKRQELAQRQQEELKIEAEKNKAAGDAFLEKYKIDQPYTLAQSGGVLYKILQPGNGPKPNETDSAVVSFKGKLIDGTIFDDKSKERFAIPLDKLNIPGLKSAILAMPAGSHWEVVIPSEAAYGPRKVGPIGPNSTLIFDLEFWGTPEYLEAQSKAEPKAPEPAAKPDPEFNTQNPGEAPE
jgi:FKBP-type peptidyl-prolyl cis-trans isomerase